MKIFKSNVIKLVLFDQIWKVTYIDSSECLSFIDENGVESSGWKCFNIEFLSDNIGPSMLITVSVDRRNINVSFQCKILTYEIYNMCFQYVDIYWSLTVTTTIYNQYHKLQID